MMRGAFAWALVVTSAAAFVARGADPVNALLGQDGRVQISLGSSKTCELAAGLFDPQWSAAAATADAQRTVDPSTRAIRLATAGGVVIKGLATVTADNGTLQAA